MTRTLALTAALVLGASALPAHATGQQNLNACKAQLVTDGYITDTTQSVRTQKMKSRKVVLSIESADGTTREAVCKISRGKVASLQVEGEDLRLVAKDLPKAKSGGN